MDREINVYDAGKEHEGHEGYNVVSFVHPSCPLCSYSMI
jgi:hypothetical protein